MAFNLATAIVTLTADKRSFNRSLKEAEHDTRTAAGRAARGFNDVFSLTLGVTAGNLLAEALLSAGRAAATSARQAFDAVADWEFLAFGIETMIARELRLRDTTLSMNDALAQSSDRAQELLGWITQTAILSPFNEASVAATFRQAQAYGFASDEAQRMTIAILDFVAGTGQTPEVAQRMALALGQIRQTGRVLAQDLNQLTNAGLSAREIIAREMGLTTGEFVKLQEDGLIPANLALNALIEALENEFGGASERAQGTLRGLVNSITDLANISLRDLFTDSFGALRVRLQDLVTTVNSPQTRQSLQAIGRFIAGGVTTALESLEALLRGFNQTARGWVANLNTMETSTARSLGRVAGFFIGLVREATFWGFKIVGALASGIAAGLGLLTRALVGIGDILARWLEPRSPPRVAPHLDRWGRRAAEIYAEGWGEADFSAFNVLGQAIEGALEVAAARGEVAGRSLVATLEAVQDAVVLGLQQIEAGGKIGADAFGFLRNAAGESGDLVARIAELYLRWEEATARVRVAQEDLQATLRGYDRQLAALREGLAGNADQLTGDEAADRVRELEEALSDASLSAEERASLEAELAQVRLGQRIRSLQEERAAAAAAGQERVAQEEKAAQAAYEALRVAQAQLAAQREMNDLLRRQQGLVRDIAGEQAEDPLEAQLRGLRIQQDELEAMIRLAELQRVIEDEKATAAERTAAELEKQAIEVERQIRAAEAADLGIDLGAIRGIEIDPRDLGLVTDELQAQLDAVDLQQRLLTNLIEQARARRTIESDTATATERAAAALELQRLGLERLTIEREAIELGVDLTGIENIPIILREALQKGVGDAAKELSDASELMIGALEGLETVADALGEDPFGLKRLSDAFSEGFDEGQTEVLVNFAKNVSDALGPVADLFELIFGRRETVVDFAGGEILRRVQVERGLLDTLREDFSVEGIKAFVDELKNAVDEADWTSFGESVATNIATALETVLPALRTAAGTVAGVLRDIFFGAVAEIGDILFGDDEILLANNVPIKVDRPGLADRIRDELVPALLTALREAFEEAANQLGPITIFPTYTIGGVSEVPGEGGTLLETISADLERVLNELTGRTLKPSAEQFKVDLSNLWSGGIILPESQQSEAVTQRIFETLDLGGRLRAALGLEAEATAADWVGAIGRGIVQELEGTAQVVGVALGGLARGILAQLANAFVGAENREVTIFSIVGAITDMLLEAVLQIGSAIPRIFVALIDGLATGFTGTEQGISEAFERSLRAAFDRTRTFVNPWTNVGEQLEEGAEAEPASPIATAIADLLRRVWDEVILLTSSIPGSVGASIVAGLVAAFTEREPSDLSNAITDFLKRAWAEAVAFTTNIPGSPAASLINHTATTFAEEDEGPLASAMAGYFKRALREAAGLTQGVPGSVGASIVAGVADGVTGEESTLQTRIQNLARRVVGWFKGPLEIRSPAGALKPVGRGIIQGVVAGAEAEFGALTQMISDAIARLTVPADVARFRQVGVTWVQSLWDGLAEWWARMLADLRERITALNIELNAVSFSGPQGAGAGSGGGSSGFGSVPAVPAVNVTVEPPAMQIDLDGLRKSLDNLAQKQSEPQGVTINMSGVTVRRDDDIRQIARQVERVFERRFAR